MLRLILRAAGLKKLPYHKRVAVSADGEQGNPPSPFVPVETQLQSLVCGLKVGCLTAMMWNSRVSFAPYATGRSLNLVVSVSHLDGTT